MSQPRIFLNPSIVLNNTDITAYCTKASILTTFNTIDVTPLGAPTRQTAQGTGDATITIDVLSDDQGIIDQLLWPLNQSGAPFAITIKPSAGPTTPANPAYDMVGWLPSYTPMDAQVGQTTSQTVQIPCADPAGITRATA